MQFERSIDIAAPTERVWTILADVERWPEWTESMTKVERLDDGPFAVGSRARVQQPKIPKAVWTVTAIEPNHSFTWWSKTAGVTIVADHEITPRDDGVRVTLRLTSRGLLAGLLGRLTAKTTDRFLTLESEGLKRVSEQSP